MALYTGRLLMRGGNESDFDPDKMMPREWAVSTDKKIVRICIAPGICIRMATYDAFEEDMAKIEAILETCQTIEEAVVKINTEVSANADAVVEYTAQAKSYMESAQLSATNAKASEEASKLSETNAKSSETNAKLSEETAQAVFESLPEDYGTLSNEFYEVAIKQTASGEDIHVNDSANAKVREFALFGKAKQQTTSGNQLLNYDAWKRAGTFNGTSIFENNGVTITATSNDAFTDPWTNSFPEEAKIYVEEGDVITLSWEEATNANGLIFIFPNGYALGNVKVNNNSKKTLSYTVSSDVEFVTFRFGVSNAGDTISYKNIMLNKGSEPLPFEPYTGGQPSPSPDYPQDIVVSGESYNLLENTATSQTNNGVTFTVNNDKSVTVNGTATSNAALVIKNYYIGAGKEIILSGCPSGGSVGKYVLGLAEVDTSLRVATDFGNGVTYTAEKDYYDVRCIVWSGVTANNLTFYPMIRKASVKNDRYMPYGVGSVEVKSCGKNYYDISKTVSNSSKAILEKTNNSVRIYNTESGTYVSSKLPIDFSQLKSGKTYTVSADVKFVSGKGRLSLRRTKDNNILNSSSYITASGKYSFTFELPNEDCYISLFSTYDVSEIGDITYSNIQIEEGTNVTPYQPYKETTATIPTENGLAGIPVDSGGNYTDSNGQQWICDEIVKYADGSGEKVQRGYKKVFDGTEEWGAVATNKDGVYRKAYTGLKGIIKGSVNNGVKESLCTHYIALPSNSSGTYGAIQGFSIDTLGTVYIYDEKFNTNDNSLWKAHLAENPITCLFELAEPIITPLTTEELAEIEKLQTFYSVTNISNDADCGMSVTYLADSKLYIDNRLAQIEQALIANI